MRVLFEARQWLIHRLLRRPYRLHCRVDSGTGRTLVLLHGIASSADSWTPLIKQLDGQKWRIVAFDLLGFGLSEKPTSSWVSYDVVDHARAVIAELDKRALRKPVTIVGHSMGCLIAIQVAKLRPRLVKQLVLYEPPFYHGLPNSKMYKFRVSLYFAMYEAISKRGPFTLSNMRGFQKLIAKRAGFTLDDDSWIPFKRSLRNTIMKQTAVSDLKQLNIPTRIIYGKFDQIVLRDKRELFFANTAGHVVSTHIAAAHSITKRAAISIAEQLSASR